MAAADPVALERTRRMVAQARIDQLEAATSAALMRIRAVRSYAGHPDVVLRAIAAEHGRRVADILGGSP